MISAGMIFELDMNPQGTDEWREQRGGRFTASRFGALMTNARGGNAPGKTFDSYVREVVLERLIGEPAESFEGNEYTDWGTLHEAEALHALAKATGHEIQPAPFIALDDWVGGSADGLIFPDGLVEVKCPAKSHYHLAAILDKTITPGRGYEWQIQGNLMVTGRNWALWASYDPRFPPPNRLVWFKIRKDKEMVARLEERLELAKAEAQKLLATLSG